MNRWGKRGLLILAVLVILGTVSVGCQTEKVFVSIATGGTAGVYYPLGGALAQIYNSKLKGITANAVSTGASVANVRSIQKGEYQLALVQNDIAFYGKTGTEMFTEGAQTKMTGIATLYPEVIQIVTLDGRGITSVADMRGKKVAVGAQGSGTEANARQILGAYGLQYSDLAKVDYLSFAEAASNLKDGHIDAAFITAGLPTAAIQEIAATHPMRLVSVSGPEVAKLKTDYPFYAEVTVKANTYASQTSDVATVAVKAMLIANKDLSEQLVYNLTKAFFENLDAMGAAHAQGKAITLAKAKEGMPLDLHPGAKKYFTEKGQ